MMQQDKATVLIVDDDPTFLLMLAQFFENEGYYVIQSADGEAAVSAFCECQPDCVLMDVKMPVMDGFEACRRIRLFPDGKDVPIIMVTARESDEAVDLCYESGASDYISKPIHWAVLRNRVRNLIERYRADRRIKESEHRFSQIFTSTKDAFWLIDATSFALLFVNDSYEDIFCLSKDALGKNSLAWMECVHPEDLDQLTYVVDRYRRGESDGLEEEFRIIRPDGKIHWVQVHCFPVFDFNGDVIRRVGVASDVTARKMSQNHFQVLIKSVKAVPWSLDLESGKFTFVGEQVLDVLGITADQMSDMDAWRSLVHPDDREDVAEYCRIQTARGQAHEFEYRMVVNSQIIWVRDSVAVTMSDNGPVGLSGFMFNITDKKQAEEKLRYSEQRFRKLFEDTEAISVQGYDKNRRVIYWNSASEALYGYAAKDAIGRKLEDLIIPDCMRQKVVEATQTWMNDGIDIPSAELTLRREDGSLVHVFSSHVMLYDSNNDPEMYCIDIDLTDLKLAEEKVHTLSRAVEQSPVSVIITDALGEIEYVNPSFTTITGYTAEEVLGKNPGILKSGHQDAGYYKELWKTISSGNTWQAEIVDRRKDGSNYPALMSIAPIIDVDDNVIHYVGIQQDMTAYEALEEKFHQAQKMQALGTLVGGIAHDFNNLLAGMTGNLYLARKKVSDMPDVTKKLEQVEKLGFHAADMVKQMLTFARKGTVEMKPFGLTSFMKEISKLSEAVIPESISFKKHFCHEELTIKGDATQLQQVLMNLLSNARDAVADVENAEITLTIDLFEADKQFVSSHDGLDHHLFAHLTVKDNGVGISREDKERIFEPFYTTKEVGLGTGLGLSMAYGAIHSHGGVLDVDSQTGGGASFHIYLPLIREKNIHTSSDESGDSFLGNGELILLVDDNADIRTTGKEVLESLGYRVLEASDGLQAVDLFIANRQDISLVIMDVVMPRLGGVQAVERIRAVVSDVKVIFASGYDKDAALKSEMPSGEFVLLSKPYNVVTLSRRIREQLDA